MGYLLANNINIRGLILFHGRVYDFKKFIDGIKEQNKLIQSMYTSPTRRLRVGLETLTMQMYRIESYDQEFMKTLTTEEGQA